MANQFYGYNSSYGGTGLSNAYPSRLTSGSVSDPYLSDSSLIGSSRYFRSDPYSTTDPSNYSVVDRATSMFLNHNDGLRFSGTDMAGTGMTGGFSANRVPGGLGAASAAPSLLSQTWPGVDAGAAVDSTVAGVKRSTEALYHQTVLGTHNTFGQSDAWFLPNTLAKRPRFESASNLPIYPQRAGEKDCAHYMLTRTCKFGDSCKFDHPIWVPEGGIPDWKEVPLIATSESLPERPGEPDCPYFLKTQKCKFGFRCKFNHPKDKIDILVGAVGVEGASENVDVSVLPERPSEPPCFFYMKTGKCKFGVSCKFHHPKDIQIPSAEHQNDNGEQTESVVKDDGTTGDAQQVTGFVSFTPALLHNSKGLPIRPGEVDCPFYLKTGSCKYGATCRYNHPDRTIAATLGHAIISSPAANLNIGVINPAASMLPTIDPRLAQTTLGLGPTIYPQRPGELECDFYMKTGQCKFVERCKFHHPIDRSAQTPSMTKQGPQQNVKLTLAGLPRREGAIICPFYMKTGTCKYGVTCRFDHPPPGEAIAMATVQGTSTSAGEVGEETETVQEQQD